MGRFIIKITDPKDNQDYYMEWSTVVDAPVTYGMSLIEFKKYYYNLYGIKEDELQERLNRVELNGSSGFEPYNDVNGFFEYNRAGENEEHLDKEGILNNYCREHK